MNPKAARMQLSRVHFQRLQMNCAERNGTSPGEIGTCSPKAESRDSQADVR
jgi:hypothetical protein